MSSTYGLKLIWIKIEKMLRYSIVQAYKPLNAKECSIVVNAIFDNLLAIDSNIYRALKDRLLNAAYQKTTARKTKGVNIITI